MAVVEKRVWKNTIEGHDSDDTLLFSFSLPQTSLYALNETKRFLTLQLSKARSAALEAESSVREEKVARHRIARPTVRPTNSKHEHDGRAKQVDHQRPGGSVDAQ